MSMDIFTEREKEVLELLLLGYSNKMISKKLVISNHTTKAHVASIFRKLVVQNRVQATVKCMQMGYGQNLKIENFAKDKDSSEL